MTKCVSKKTLGKLKSLRENKHRGRTAGPSTALRLSKNTFPQPEKEPQISPLRFASVEMTSSWVNRSSGFSTTWVGRQAHEPSGRDDKLVTNLRDQTLEIAINMSSRPERTRISYFATIHNGHVCGSLQRETHELYRSNQSRQEIRGSAVEGPAVLQTALNPHSRSSTVGSHAGAKAQQISKRLRHG